MSFYCSRIPSQIETDRSVHLLVLPLCTSQSIVTWGGGVEDSLSNFMKSGIKVKVKDQLLLPLKIQNYGLFEINNSIYKTWKNVT